MGPQSVSFVQKFFSIVSFVGGSTVTPLTEFSILPFSGQAE